MQSVMTEEEGAALAIKESVKQLFQPVQDLVQKLVGPAATEVGLAFGDSAKLWGFKRQLGILKEVQRLIDESGLKINPIATRLFFPVLEAASIEDDDDMQTRWAALIANESTKVGSVHPSFIEILRQMAPDDARLLDRLYARCLGRLTRTVTPWVEPIVASEMEERVQAGENPYTPFNNLVRLGLIENVYSIDSKKVKIQISQDRNARVGRNTKFEGKLDHHFELADIAYLFVAACRSPKKNVEESANKGDESEEK